MRISNIIGILGLAAMLFLVVIATGIAHADQSCHAWNLDSYFCQEEVKKITLIMTDTDGDSHFYTYDRTDGWQFKGDVPG